MGRPYSGLTVITARVCEKFQKNVCFDNLNWFIDVPLSYLRYKNFKINLKIFDLKNNHKNFQLLKKRKHTNVLKYGIIFKSSLVDPLTLSY